MKHTPPCDQCNSYVATLGSITAYCHEEGCPNDGKTYNHDEERWEDEAEYDDYNDEDDWEDHELDLCPA